MNLIKHPNLAHIIDAHFQSICPKVKAPKNGKIYHADSVAGKLYAKTQDPTLTPGQLILFNYLYKNVEDIITGNVSVLNKNIKKIKSILKKNRLSLKAPFLMGNLGDAIYNCFYYKSYSESNKPYVTLKALGLDTCPYCNRQYIHTYQDPAGQTRATLDHFYSKEIYPYLALSFYNLIPSCYSCNSSIKGRKEFSTTTHINPYNVCFDNIVKFSINFQKANHSNDYIAQFYQDENYLRIFFEFQVPIGSPELKKAKGNIDSFHLENLYNLHKDLVVELLQKQAVYYQSGYAKSLAQTYPKLFKNEEEIVKMLLGNYIQSGNLSKRPFSRLTRDICEEIGLTQEILNDLK